MTVALRAAVLLELGDDRALRLVGRQPSKRPELTSFPSSSMTSTTGRTNVSRELAVALVVGGDGHDRARAVVHEDVVGDPDRELLAVDGVDRVEAGEDAGLLGRRRAILDRPRAGVARVLLRLVARVRVDERMLRREDEERRAEQRVGARREDGDVVARLLDAEEDFGALGAADPVALDRLRLLRPLGARVLEELVGVRGRAHEPLRHVPQLDLGAAALAVAVDDVLVRDDGLVVRAPVDRAFLAVAEVMRDELLEEPLRPAVEGRLVRGDLALPVDRPAEALHLGAHRLDVRLDRDARMAALLDRGVLCRQAERVPAHRAHDVPAAAPAHVRLDVAHRVVEDVAHVEARAGRVRQHLELVPVVLGRRLARDRVRDAEGALVLPDALPFRFDLVWLVSRCLVQNVS